MKLNSEHQIKLSQLRILLAVAKSGSFSEAALHLEMSQSAVSNAIASLEATLGVELFCRGRHGASPTPIGIQMIAHAHQMQDVLTAMMRDAHSARSLQGGQVRISSFRSVSTHILPSLIAQFYQQYPQIPVSVLEHFDDLSIAEDLRKGRADIGFVERTLSDEFDTWELMRDEYVVLLPAHMGKLEMGKLEKIGVSLSWEQLSAYPLIMGPEEFDRHIYAHCALYGKALQVAYYLKEDSTIVSMVAQGLGATIIPRLAAEPIPASVQVCNLPVPLFRMIRVAVLANALQIPAVFAFLDLLKQQCQEGKFGAISA
ncbi:MAG: LysR family transcriptional regulator [Cyanobacteria bacterium RM1_2_2]|nr:LysR family transcriptional regulator [Cyanobacteria bacterium RM1_2_2]